MTRKLLTREDVLAECHSKAVEFYLKHGEFPKAIILPYRKYKLLTEPISLYFTSYTNQPDIEHTAYVNILWSKFIRRIILY